MKLKQKKIGKKIIDKKVGRDVFIDIMNFRSDNDLVLMSEFYGGCFNSNLVPILPIILYWSFYVFLSLCLSFAFQGWVYILNQPEYRWGSSASKHLTYGVNFFKLYLSFRHVMSKLALISFKKHLSEILYYLGW